MSTFSPADVDCPACGRSFTVQILEGLHVTRLPAMRAQILGDDFQRFVCPRCGAATRVVAPVIYTDFARHQYVALETGPDEHWRAAAAKHDEVFTRSFELGPPLARELGAPFVKRLVFGVAALREKLLLWDAGLDDRVVEALKHRRLDRLGVTPGQATLRLAAVLPGGHLLCGRHPPAPRTAAGPVNVVEAPPPVDFETLLAADYEALAARPEQLRRHAWLADEWYVDVHASA